MKSTEITELLRQVSLCEKLELDARLAKAYLKEPISKQRSFLQEIQDRCKMMTKTMREKMGDDLFEKIYNM